MKKLVLISLFVCTSVLCQELTLEIPTEHHNETNFQTLPVPEGLVERTTPFSNQANSLLVQLQVSKRELLKKLRTPEPLLVMWKNLNYYANLFSSAEEKANSPHTERISKELFDHFTDYCRKLTEDLVKEGNALIMSSHRGDAEFVAASKKLRALEAGLTYPLNEMTSLLTAILLPLRASLDNQLLMHLQSKEIRLLALLANPSQDAMMLLQGALSIKEEYNYLASEINLSNPGLYLQCGMILGHITAIINSYTQFFYNDMGTLGTLLSEKKDIEFSARYRKFVNDLAFVAPSLLPENIRYLEDRLGFFYIQFVAQIQAEIETVRQSELFSLRTLESTDSLWWEISWTATKLRSMKESQFDEQLKQLIEQFLIKFDQEVSTLTDPLHLNAKSELYWYILIFEDGPARLIDNDHIRTLHGKLTEIYRYFYPPQ